MLLNLQLKFSSFLRLFLNNVSCGEIFTWRAAVFMVAGMSRPSRAGARGLGRDAAHCAGHVCFQTLLGCRYQVPTAPGWQHKVNLKKSGSQSPDLGDMWRHSCPESPDWDSDGESWSEIEGPSSDFREHNVWKALL